MKYREDKKGRKISQLGYGCMRFTKKGGRIDYKKAEKEVLMAIDQGVNYFDTAYIYSGSEECLGRILDENDCRDKVYIATKLPQYLMRSLNAIEKTFNEQLARLRTDHIDYYLMHMFTDISEWEKLVDLGIEKWIDDHRSNGSIGSIGFSFHGDTETFLKILDVYDWDFCQIQYNYLDEHSQAGRRGLEAAADRGIPVIIMEPLRGGKLVEIPGEAKKKLENFGSGYTPAEIALRWLWDQPQVTSILSGMNSEEMIEENCRIASRADAGDLTEEERDLIESIKEIIREKEKVPCTSCRYCMPCPAGVDIPACFHFYNLMYLENPKSGRWGFFQNMGMRGGAGFPSQCVACGRCEAHCPQKIEIVRNLKQADRALLPLPYKAALKIARKIMKRS